MANPNFETGKTYTVTLGQLGRDRADAEKKIKKMGLTLTERGGGKTVYSEEVEPGLRIALAVGRPRAAHCRRGARSMSPRVFEARLKPDPGTPGAYMVKAEDWVLVAGAETLRDWRDIAADNGVDLVPVELDCELKGTDGAQLWMGISHGQPCGYFVARVEG